MPDVKISALTGASTPLAGTEVLPIVQSSSTVKVSVADLTAGRAVSATSIATDLGAVGTPSYTFTGDTNTGMWSPAADTIAFSEGGAEAMRIDSSGNVGIGTISPSVRLDVIGNAIFGRGGGASQGIILSNNDNSASAETISFINSRNNLGVNDSNTFFGHQTDGGSYIALGTTAPGDRNTDRRAERMRINSSGNVGIGTASPATKLHVSVASGYNEIRVASGANNLGLAVDGSIAYLATFQTTPLTFQTNSAERMRIASGGDVGIGTNAPSYKLQVNASSGANQVAYFVNDSAGSTLAGIGASINGGGNNTNSYHFVGVTQTVALWYLYGNGTTSYTSDIRVKKNVTTTRDGYLDDVCKLRVVKYNWYNDSDDTPRELGLIAQEVEQVFPGLVQDAMHPTKDDEIHKVLKGSVLTPILLKALQEANAKIDALATRVAQLESPAEQ